MDDNKVPSARKKPGAKVGKPKGAAPKKDQPIKSDQAMFYTLGAALKKLHKKAPDAPNGGKRKA